MAWWRQILAHAIQTEGHRIMGNKFDSALSQRTDLPVCDIGQSLDRPEGRIPQDIADVLPGLDDRRGLLTPSVFMT